MLIVSRKLNEKIVIGDGIEITVLGWKGQAVSIGIDAPKTIEVHRKEVFEKKQKIKEAESV